MKYETTLPPRYNSWLQLYKQVYKIAEPHHTIFTMQDCGENEGALYRYKIAYVIRMSLHELLAIIPEKEDLQREYKWLARDENYWEAETPDFLLNLLNLL